MQPPPVINDLRHLNDEAVRYASKEYLSETKREILDSIRDLARRIEHP
jgi:hypothetical protein